MTISEYELINPEPATQITLQALEEECQAYQEDDASTAYDAYYAPASRLVFYGAQHDLWDSICGGVCLLVYAWNAPFYRSPFSYTSFEANLRTEWNTLIEFRLRPLVSLNSDDHQHIQRVFESLTIALSSGGRRAQVSAAKALHIVAPTFFPMWDHAIAYDGYNCPYGKEPGLAYVAFCRRIQIRVRSLQADWDSLPNTHWLRAKPLLKRIDEFNFMRRPPRTERKK
jgi:hypothetical protein